MVEKSDEILEIVDILKIEVLKKWARHRSNCLLSPVIAHFEHDAAPLGLRNTRKLLTQTL